MITNVGIVRPPMITTISASMAQAAMVPHLMTMQVAELNKQRNEKTIYRIRDYWLALKEHRADLEAGAEKGVKWYERFKKRVPQLHEKAREFEDEIYQINKPKPHKYEILKSE